MINLNTPTNVELVKALMLDGQWRTLREIADSLLIPEAGVSARLRDLRKPAFGGYTVERSLLIPGVYQYRVLAPVAQPEPELATV